MTFDEEKQLRDWIRTIKPPALHHMLLIGILAVQLELLSRQRGGFGRDGQPILPDAFFPAAAERELEPTT